MTVKPTNKEVETLNAELFGMVEAAQGYFHVSDGETFPSTEAYFERIRGRLEWGEEAVRLMRTFLARHGQLNR